MGYRKLFEECGIRHSNSGLQIIHDMYINGYFDLTPNQGALEGLTSHLDNGNMRVVLKSSKPLLEPISCIFYFELQNSVRIDYARKYTRNV